MINKVLFMGSKSLGYSILKQLYSINPNSLDRIITIDDTQDTRSYYKQYHQFAEEHQIPIKVLKKPSELFSVIQKTQPELVMVSGWYWIIPKKALNIVPKGFIGIHSSLLPQYRGGAPLVWAIINGNKKTGVSLFYFDEGIDTGDIIDQREFIIEQDSNISSLLNKMEKESIDMVNSNYEKILNETNNRKPQSQSSPSYCAIRKPEDGLIDWSLSNIDIHNFIRAQSDPYPGAFTFIKDKKYYLIKSKIIKESYYGSKGIIAKLNSDSIIVCCGENALEITNIRDEYSNKNIISKMKFGDKFK